MVTATFKKEPVTSNGDIVAIRVDVCIDYKYDNIRRSVRLIDAFKEACRKFKEEEDRDPEWNRTFFQGSCGTQEVKFELVEFSG